jgi:hypothetical protein
LPDNNIKTGVRRDRVPHHFAGAPAYSGDGKRSAIRWDEFQLAFYKGLFIAVYVAEFASLHTSAIR